MFFLRFSLVTGHALADLQVASVPLANGHRGRYRS
jgi:hypothetical protein